jgi:hypothetical protein
MLYVNHFGVFLYSELQLSVNIIDTRKKLGFNIIVLYRDRPTCRMKAFHNAGLIQVAEK